MKKIWNKYGSYLVESPFLSDLLLWVWWLYFQLVYFTTKKLPNSHCPKKIHSKYNPFIITFWHGRHLMGPFLRPKTEQITAIFSRSKDAELNAKLGKLMGLNVVRGSGGRNQADHRSKGGARALLRLRKSLQEGGTVSMIANISHVHPREVGRGLIMLAKISSRPIVPYIYVFSREIVLHKTWDKTTIPLPFGRSVFLAGKPFFVPADSTDEDIEKYRKELTVIMDDLTNEAYAMFGKKEVK